MHTPQLGDTASPWFDAYAPRSEQPAEPAAPNLALPPALVEHPPAEAAASDSAEALFACYNG